MVPEPTGHGCGIPELQLLSPANLVDGDRISPLGEPQVLKLHKFDLTSHSCTFGIMCTPVGLLERSEEQGFALR